jgi:hypothetical protein
MTISRAIGITSGVGAFLSGIASAVNIINPKWGGIVAAVGGAITMFCERAHGTPEYRRRQRMKKEVREFEDRQQVHRLTGDDADPEDARPTGKLPQE